MKNKALFYFCIKIFVSAILIRWLVQKIGSVSIIKNMSLCSVKTVAFTFISLWLCYALSAWRWCYIVQKGESGHFSFINSARIVAIANFLNQGLPGSIGGDVYRGFALTRFGFSKSWSIQSLFLDRMFGLVFMSVMGLFALISFDWDLMQKPECMMLILIMLAIVCGFTLFCQLDRIRLPEYVTSKVAFLCNMTKVSRQFFGAKDILFMITGFMVMFFLYFPVYLFAVDLGYKLSLTAILFVMPMVFLLSSLPISFAGWGVRETTFITLFGLFGMPNDQALTLSVMYGLVSLFSVMPGLLVYLFAEKANASA